MNNSFMNHASTKASPMQPVPPPHKKQKATNVNDAISRRRAQLLRLQKERSMSSAGSSSTTGTNGTTNGTNTTQDLLARARKQLQQLQHPPPTQQQPQQPQQQHVHISQPVLNSNTSSPLSSPPPPPIPNKSKSASTKIPTFTSSTTATPTTSNGVVHPPPIQKMQPETTTLPPPSSSTANITSPPPPPKSTLPPTEEGPSSPQNKTTFSPPPPPLAAQPSPSQKPFKKVVENEEKITLDDLQMDDDLTLLVTPAKKKKSKKSIPKLMLETPLNNRDLLNGLREGADTPQNQQQQQRRNQEVASRSRVLEAMRKGAETPRREPDQQPESSSMLRLVKELKIAIQDKTKALNQVQSLEGKLAETMEQKSVWTTHLEELLHQSQINEALMFLQKQKQPISTTRGRTSHRRSDGVNTTSRRRMKSPEPTPRRQNNSTTDSQYSKDKSNKNGQDVSVYLKQALTMVPYEYDSEYATFVVRTSVSEGEYEWPFPPSSTDDCQILAKIKADHSKLFLMNESQGQHVFLEDAPKLYENMEEETLGCITYIDVYGEEKEYWLDVIYEQAMATRETFLSKLQAAAEVLQQNNQHQSTPPSNATPNNNIPPTTIATKPPLFPKKPVMVDVSVGTDDLPQIQQKQKQPQPSTSEPVKQKEETVVEPQDSGSTDVLSWAVSNFFIFIFETIWFCLITFPFRLVYNTLLLIVFTVSIALLWVYIANDNGAMNMGAGIDTMFQPGIY